MSHGDCGLAGTKRARKRHPLSQEQKVCNRVLSRKRIRVENIICRLKILRILSERYRNCRQRFGLRFNLMDAICNMELKMKHSSTFGRGLLQVGDTENNSGLSFSLALLIYGFGIPFTLPVAALPLYGDV